MVALVQSDKAVVVIVRSVGRSILILLSFSKAKFLFRTGKTNIDIEEAEFLAVLGSAFFNFVAKLDAGGLANLKGTIPAGAVLTIFEGAISSGAEMPGDENEAPPPRCVCLSDIRNN